jgi:7-keto-8-aminopelargonate synthetase-like enzyme
MSVMEGPPGAVTVIDGKECVYFGGTGYFGLQGHPELIRAGIEAFRMYGTHGATSRAGFGNNPVLGTVEARLKEFFGTPDAAYFGSGYLSSLILAQTLKDDCDAVFVDESSHVSVVDAAASVRKPVFHFRHRDPGDLARKLRIKLRPRWKPLLLTDGVFPVYGRIAPLPDYIRTLAPYGGILAVDDAHGAGVLGPNGRGVLEHFGLRSGSGHMAGTLSKAFGGHGGFIVGGKGLIARVRKQGAYLGSTPTPTPIAAASARGIELVSSHPEMRARLRENVALAKAGLKKIGVDADDTPVPIVAWSLRTAAAMEKIQRALFAQGIAIALIKYPGTPPQGVLRVTIFSTHTAAQIERLIDGLRRTL